MTSTVGVCGRRKDACSNVTVASNLCKSFSSDRICNELSVKGKVKFSLVNWYRATFV